MGEEVLAFTQDMGMRNKTQTTKQTQTCLFTLTYEPRRAHQQRGSLTGNQTKLLWRTFSNTGMFPQGYIQAGMRLMMTNLCHWPKLCRSALFLKHTGTPQNPASNISHGIRGYRLSSLAGVSSAKSCRNKWKKTRFASRRAIAGTLVYVLHVKPPNQAKGKIESSLT